MNSKIISKGILRALSVVVGVCILLYFLYAIQSVLGYIAISIVVSLIGRPIVQFLRTRLKFNNLVAVSVTILLLLGFMVGLVSLFIPMLVEQGQNLSLLDIEALEANVENLYQEATGHFNLKPLDIEESIKDSKVFSKINFSLIPDFLNSLISGFGSFSIALFSILFISFFFLKDSRLIQSRIMSTIPFHKRSIIITSTEKIKDLLSRYFIGLILQIGVLFIIYTIGLLIIGVENPIVIAFLCALINLIPYLGPIIGGSIMLFLTMTSNLGQSFSDVILPITLQVLIVILIGQVIDNFLSQPLIFSKSVKSHPLEIFLIIIIGGLLFGIVGMIVAVPVYTAIKVILKAFLSENKLVQVLTEDI